MMTKNYTPDIAIHPGSTLNDTLEALKMSQIELAERTGVSKKHINEIINQKSPITPETALKFASVFGTSPAFWNNLQKQYEETCARLEQEKSLVEEVPLLEKFDCYKELVRWGYIEWATSQVERVKLLCHFFGVSSLNLVPKLHAVAYRKVHKDNLNKESLAAWLRCGELESIRITSNAFNRDLLRESLGRLRGLTRETPEVFSKLLPEICAECGVVVVFVPYFKNIHVCGAARWINDRPVIQLSLRGGFSDIFWFSFFHELGHILKHGKKEQFVDLEKEFKEDTDKEKEADEFATNTLISPKEYEVFVSNRMNLLSLQAVRRFADDINIAPAIVAGRLAHDYSDWIRWASLRTRLKFKEKTTNPAT